MRATMLFPLMFLVACELEEEKGGSGDTGTTPADTDTDTDADTDTDTDADTDSDTDTDTDTDTDADTDTAPTADTGTAPATGWVAYAHPCVGNRTDALHFDDDGTAWVGCGTTTTGYGLYQSTDGGVTWSAPTTTPNGYLDTFRVNSIQRADDGYLYIAGTNTVSDARAVRMDASGTLEIVYESQGLVWNGFQSGTFRRNSAGYAVSESLTGSDVVVIPSDGAPIEDGYGWWGKGQSFQMLDMELHDDQFYGCGSTIAVPPHVFLPPPDGSQTTGSFTMVAYQLATGIAEFDGEMWDIDVDASGVAVAGVDQGRDVGHVFVSGADPHTDPWLDFDVSLMFPGEATWMRGVCRDGDHLVATGEFTIFNEGIVVESTDGGATWTDVTPKGAPPLHKCVIHDDGTFTATGADGWFGTYTPAN